ncbi:hypothetical protein [Deinococcus aetherius]|uniref:hypothetical protein n=1 Tax=Deinococcus aetherius TaxID=200252 RepID=UPI00222E49FE|nr:hypothetical protein [Deinococcus aetherius]
MTLLVTVGLLGARLTDAFRNGWRENFLADRRDLSARVRGNRRFMGAAVPDAKLNGHGFLISTLPDPGE